MATAVLAVALSLIAPSSKEGKARIDWSRDHVHSYAEAEERRQPLLIHFRNGNCGPVGVPVAPGGPRPAGYQTERNDCDLMQQEVWEAQPVARSAERFVRVLVDTGDQTLNVRYQVVVSPTTIVTDPWGNEMLRVSHYLEPEKMDRLLNAIPRDFSALTPWARALRENGSDLKALMGAAGFYETRGLRQVSERLYERAQAAAVAADPTARRQASLARGLNLLLMGRGPDAARVFAKALDEGPDQPGADALLLGLVNSHLTMGKRKDAEEAYRRLSSKFPDSPYTKRAKENLEAAKK
jgi:tetratricopeptide (TPR) repeat protein